MGSGSGAVVDCGGEVAMVEDLAFWTIILLAFLPCLISFLKRSEADEPWRDRDREISDEEFLEACSVKDARIALGVRKVLSDCSGIDERNIHPNDRLVRDLGMY